MLTDAELCDMRTLQALTFDQVATVTRRVYADDGAGGQTETTTTSSLSCRVAPASAQQAAGVRSSYLGGQFAEIQIWKVTFAALADVRKNDRIVVAGKSLEVQGVLGAESRETARVTLCVERV